VFSVLYNLRVFLIPHIFTMMHLCIIQCTCWTPLHNPHYIKRRFLAQLISLARHFNDESAVKVTGIPVQLIVKVQVSNTMSIDNLMLPVRKSLKRILKCYFHFKLSPEIFSSGFTLLISRTFGLSLVSVKRAPQIYFVTPDVEQYRPIWCIINVRHIWSGSCQRKAWPGKLTWWGTFLLVDIIMLFCEIFHSFMTTESDHRDRCKST